MIISRGRRYIFVHIPKTGGTAMALALEERAMADDILIGDTPKAKRRKGRLKGVHTGGRLWKHSTLADVEGLVTRAEMADFVTFTLVRNPWDRAVSYYHWLQDQTFDHPAVTLAQALSFAEFIAHDHTRSSLRAAPYSAYMRDGGGQEHCTHYVRLEHLADLAPIEDHLGFKIDMPRVNTSSRRADWHSYYDATTRGIVADACAEDIARFDYSFDDSA
ncbi:sulfotransferase family 2 domain-containing protein [Octadecabacter sp. R77987]|uniref:sulfotransferase family 2 domain-containing protein n=1 Tax=Octadecabacter sp. R77987 TaxID=3093874 RepID=UPI0036732364